MSFLRFKSILVFSAVIYSCANGFSAGELFCVHFLPRVYSRSNINNTKAANLSVPHNLRESWLWREDGHSLCVVFLLGAQWSHSRSRGGNLISPREALIVFCCETREQFIRSNSVTLHLPVSRRKDDVGENVVYSQHVCFEWYLNVYVESCAFCEFLVFIKKNLVLLEY